MAVRNQLELLSGGLGNKESGARTPVGRSRTTQFLDKSRLGAAGIFIVTVAAILLVSSAGLNVLNFPVQLGQVATMREVAMAPFSYASNERTSAAREQLLHRVPPIYRIELDGLRQFQMALAQLRSRLEIFSRDHPNPPVLASARSELQAIADQFNSHGPYRVTAEDLADLVEAGDATTRNAAFDNGLAALRDIYAEGVRDDALAGAANGTVVFEVSRPNGVINPRPVQSMEEALTFLRVSLLSDNANRTAGQAAFRFFRNGVAPNVVFDAPATRARENLAAASLRPVTVNIVKGQVILEAGQRVGPDTYEMLMAYRQFLRDHSDSAESEVLLMLGRVLLVVAMIFASLIYIRLEDAETLRSNVRLGLLALVVILNLALVRAIYSLGGAEFLFGMDHGHPPCRMWPRPRSRP